MAAPGTFAVLVAFSAMTSAANPAGTVQAALHLPKLSIQAPATIPAAPSPRLRRDDLAGQAPADEVDITGPAN